MVIPVLAMDAVPALAMVAISDVVLVLAITDVAPFLVATGVTTDVALIVVITDVAMGVVITDMALDLVTMDTVLVPVTMDIGAVIGGLIIMVMTGAVGVATRQVRLCSVWRSVLSSGRRLLTPIHAGKAFS